VSAEEKEAFQKKEIEGKVRGLLQKYIDGVLTLDRLKTELDGLGHSKQATAMGLVREACLARIEPAGDNSRLIELLQDPAGLDPEPIRRLLTKCDAELMLKRKQRRKELLKGLKESGISGSAVIPHIEADEEWKDYLLKTREEFQARLRELV
jgi:hypothetical protein